MALIRFTGVEQARLELWSHRLNFMQIFHSAAARWIHSFRFAQFRSDQGVDRQCVWEINHFLNVICFIFYLIDSQWIISYECHFVSHASNLIMFSLSFGCQAHYNLRLCLYTIDRSLARSLFDRSFCASTIHLSIYILFNCTVSLSKQTNYRVYCHCITSQENCALTLMLS